MKMSNYIQICLQLIGAAKHDIRFIIVKYFRFYEKIDWRIVLILNSCKIIFGATEISMIRNFSYKFQLCFCKYLPKDIVYILAVDLCAMIHFR